MRLYYITGREAAHDIQQEGFEDEGIHLGLYSTETRAPVYHQDILLMGMNPWDIDLGQEEGSVFLLNIPDYELMGGRHWGTSSLLVFKAVQLKSSFPMVKSGSTSGLSPQK